MHRFHGVFDKLCNHSSLYASQMYSCMVNTVVALVTAHGALIPNT